MRRTSLSRISIVTASSIAASLVIVGGMALAAQDRSSLKVPNGLAFSEFRGYQNWQTVAVSQTEKSLKVISANPVMMKAFRRGLPADGKHFPEGSKVVKIEWTAKKNDESPYFVMIPDKLKSISFIEKNTKRFPKTAGWAFAQFQNDAATATLKPFGDGAECGFACHTKVKDKDYIFTAYPER